MLNVQPVFRRLTGVNSLAMKSPFVEYIEYAGFTIVGAIARSLSYNTAGRVGSFLGGVAYRLIGQRRRLTLENLAHAFPEKTDLERSGIALAAFRNYGTALVEMLWSTGQSVETLIKAVAPGNLDVVKKYFDRAGGLVLLSGHYGNWEFLSTAFRLQLGKPLAIIAQHQRNRRIDAVLDASRTRWDNRTISMGVSSREAFRALREGAIVILLGDQSGPKEAVYIDFFGRPAATHRGAAAFSLKTGAPLIMVFMVRQNDGTYKAVCEEVDRGGSEAYTEENVTELTRRHTAMLEKHIRLHPDHWLWMHNRWKHTEYYEDHKMVEEEA